MLRVAIYVRVSTDKQAKEGDSVPAQLSALRQYINERDSYVNVGEYIDDGISGTKDDRNEYQRMLSDVRAGKIDFLVCTKLDRIHRGLKNFLLMQETLDKHGVGWLAIWEPIYDSTTPQGRLIINQMMSIAQFEAENTGQRIRQVMAYKLSQGEVVSGRKPWGYDIRNKHLVPNEHADVARQIFEYFDRTGNKAATIRYARSLGYTCQYNSLTKMLMQSKYMGAYKGKENYCPPIISKELFESVQKKLKMNVKASSKRDYIFSGLIVCAECGLRYTCGLNSSHRKRYRCQGKYSRISPVCNNATSITENVLERTLVENISGWIAGKQAIAKTEEQKRTEVTSQIRRLERRLLRLKDLYLDGDMDINEYKKEKQKLTSELSTIETPEPVKDYGVIMELIGDDLETRYQDMSEENRRNFWRSIISEIKIDKDRNVTVEFL